MAGAALKTGTAIAMRFIIEAPVAGVLHSLQDKKNHCVDPQRAVAGADLAFDFSIRIAPGPRFLGEHVRSEGPVRRFVYICVGKPAGDPACCWSRRMKIDIHDLPEALVEAALAGKRLVASIPGTAPDGTPSCATVRPRSWTFL